ncbi:bifunctional protein-serine/threonine kinase/phosphatase [Microbulbifer bruguierae]|uniref:Bifunctional protein-serine/threonine kinase/phosphatase n=1 Tax=Microbulbifer bruguierae TaxID=3029061 RepID=A0ABY8NHC7_9GAMM|nr:bifunctional protein-serine/threonine kinase/phosphatase [Microbulbifer bruguierae]WGL18100.1 bifunctional protein-serine/threonine kinase/phosphatase [Microbulbifer bruguierae]
MNNTLSLEIGHYTSAGLKPENQDSCGARVPLDPQLGLKGAAFAIADGISSSPVSAIASQTAVKSFLDDYYCTSDGWNVQQAAERVLKATNAWLYGQTQQSPYRFERDKGYVCTFSAAILQGAEAHLFHLGDSRIYRLRRGTLEQLTHDHRKWVGEVHSYLSRALGASQRLDVDYRQVSLEPGDLLVFTTDGVHETLPHEFLTEQLALPTTSLNTTAKALVDAALANGSNDNLTVQLVRVTGLPEPVKTPMEQAGSLPLPPLLKAGDSLDGYIIEREIHASSRSHVYLATDKSSGIQAILKMPSIDLADDPAYLERLLMEEWIARRVNSTHVVRAATSHRPRNFLYTAMEVVEGQTLRQWMTDNPDPQLETVRRIVEQIASGLQALHRAEILHQDLRPENIIISPAGTVTVIDLGSARVDGIAETFSATISATFATTDIEDNPDSAVNSGQQILGTALYTAPEYFLGDMGSARSDLFSLAVLTYHLLSGEFPYGTQVARCTTVAAQHKLRYRSVLSETRAIPAWIDATLKKALQPNPRLRHEALSEFVYELRHPNPQYLHATRPPLMERYPVRFWQSVSGVLLLTVLYLLSLISSSA